MANSKKKQLIKKAAKLKEQRRTASIGSTSTPWFAYLIIFALALGLYLQTISYEYVLDDQIVYTDNQFTKQGFAGITDILSTESFAGYFGEQKDLLPGARYRPLSIITYAIEYQLFGQKSTISHFINALLYAVLCLLIYKTLLIILKPQSASWKWTIPFVASILYVLHPLHTEVVANVKGRDEILAMLFSIGALFAIFKSIETKKLLWISIAIVSFFLGLLAKENTITFFAIIPLTLYCFRENHWKDILVTSSLFLTVIVLYLIMRYNIIGYLISNGQVSDDIMNNPFINMSLGEKYATIMYTLGHYLRLNIFPHPLTHDYYPFQIPTMNWLKPQTIISTITYISLIAVSLAGLRKKKIWTYGILFYMIALSIVSNLVISVGTTMNERFVFMASLGICIALAFLIVRYIPTLKVSWSRYLAIGVFGILAVGFTIKSLTRIPVWENPETLNAAAVKVSTNSARANSFMATALYNKVLEGNLTQSEKETTINEADFYADKSINIFPSYTNGNLMKAGISAEKYKLTNNLDVLLQDFTAVATRRPDIKFLHEYYEYLNGSQNQNKLYNFYYDVGRNHLYNAGNYQWALSYLSYAHKINPNTYEINQALFETYTALGQEDKAAQFGYNAKSLKSNGR